MVELRKVDDQDMIIFYHDRRNELTPSIVGNKARIKSKEPVELQNKSDDIKKVLDSLTLSSSRNVIDFSLNKDFKFVGKSLYGENLIAFKVSKIGADVKQETKEAQAQENNKENKNSTKISDVTVKVTDSAKTKKLEFPFDTRNVGAAIFQRGQDLWIVFDKRVDFYIPKTGFIEEWNQINDVKNTIVKVSLKAGLFANTKKRKNNWVVELSPKKSLTKNHLTPLSVNEGLVNIKSVGDVKNIVSVRDFNVGDVLKIIPVKNPGFGISKEQTKLDYKILDSNQGVAISLISDDVKIDYNPSNQTVDISSLYIESGVENSIDSANNTSNKSLLPFDDDPIYQSNFMVDKKELFDELTATKTNPEVAEKFIDFAKFYFSHSMYQEALSMIYQAENYALGMTKTPEVQILKAVSLSLIDRELDARAVYTDLKQSYAFSSSAGEIDLWDKYNEVSLENNISGKIGVIDNKLVESYPDEIYWKLVFAELDLLVRKADTKSIDSILKSIRKSDDVSIHNHIKYYKARYFYLLDQTNLAENLLEEVKNNAQNGKEYLMADLQLIKIIYEQKRLNWISAVQKLNSLRFVWRGDKHEMQLLMAMGLAYQQNNDIINAIRTYKYIVDAFGSDSQNSFFITSQIVELYRRIFLSDEMEELDDFSVVALFYEFKDYTPIGVDGDRVVLGIARRMLNLDLLEMAQAILEHQVMYRLRGIDRMVTANHLALVLLMDKKPVKALRILNDTDNENFGYVEHQKRTLLKAKALIDLEKYKEALSYLGDSGGEDSYMLKSEILFRSNRWSDFINNVSPQILRKVKDGDLIYGIDGQLALRLAISYSMLNRSEELQYLHENLITENKELKAVIGFLKSTNNPINPRNVDQMLGIDMMDTFLDNYRKLLFS